MKSEILTSIKQIEEECRLMISEAKAERERRIASAKLEADNLIMRARVDTEEYKKKCFADARNEAAKKRDAIIKARDERVASLRTQGKKNLEKAVALLISRFKEHVHVKA